MYSLKIVTGARNQVDINLLTKIQHFNNCTSISNFAMVSCNIYLFICNKYGAILAIKFYSKAKIRQPPSFITLRNLQNPYPKIKKNMPQPWIGGKKKKKITFSQRFKIYQDVNLTISTINLLNIHNIQQKYSS